MDKCIKGPRHWNSKKGRNKDKINQNWRQNRPQKPKVDLAFGQKVSVDHIPNQNPKVDLAFGQKVSVDRIPNQNPKVDLAFGQKVSVDHIPNQKPKVDLAFGKKVSVNHIPNQKPKVDLAYGQKLKVIASSVEVPVGGTMSVLREKVPVHPDKEKKIEIIKPKLFSKDEQYLFWKFINFVNSIGTHSNTTMGYDYQVTEFALITISFNFSRQELDYFEQIYWFVLHFIEQKYQTKITKYDQDRINRIFCFGHRSFSEFIGSTQNLAISLVGYKPYPNFTKIFLKYPKGRIPTMILDSRTYPGWDHN